MIKLLLCLAAFAFAAVDIVNQPVNTWVSIPNSNLSAVDPCPARNCSYSGNSGQGSVISAWNSGVFDTKRNRLVVWGGGHMDYWGNEIYAFNVDSMKWSRLTDPSTSLTFNTDPMADGKPLARHTYGGIAYMSHIDRFFAMGGSGANSGSGVHNTWTFNFDNLAWTSMGNCGFGVGLGSTCAYDPSTKKVYWGEGNNSNYQAWGMYSYTYETNTWTRLNTVRPYYYYTSAFDTKRGLLFFIGSGHVYVYDIKNANYTEQAWTTTGNTGFISKIEAGLEYDPVSDKIVGWHGGGVYALDPDTKVWTVYNGTGEPTQNSNGTYGHWRYVPKVNAFIDVNSATGNVYFYKLTAGLGTTAEQRALPQTGIGVTILPNPFTDRAEINFAGKTAVERLCIYDLQGRLVKDLTGKIKAGQGSSTVWDSRGMPAGLYLIKAVSAGKTVSKTLLLTR
jgi:hypothetical protein